jgi:hypothetical protein
MRTYAHVMPSAEDKTRAVLEAAWSVMSVSREQASTV